MTPELRKVVRSLKPFDIVQVIWEDAYTYIQDTTIEEASNRAKTDKYIRKTLGYVVLADDDHIVVGGTDDRQASQTSAEVADITVMCTGFVRDVLVIQRDKK